MEILELSLEEYVKKYYEELKADLPPFIKYIDLITNEAFYFSQLYSFHQSRFSNFEYPSKVDKLEVFETCNEILGTLCPKYQDEYNELIKRKQITYLRNKSGFSYLNNKLKVKIIKTGTIEDIFGTIHELIHKIHVGYYNNQFDNSDWYFLSEMIAMTFESYAMFYLYKQDRYREDIKVYFNKLLEAACLRSIGIIHEALILDIYDKEKSIDDDKIEEFIQKKKMDPDSKAILDLFFDDDKDFSFHEEATYTFGYPLAIQTGLLMAYNPEYLEKVVNSFNNISSGSIEDFLKNINSNILDSNSDTLYDLVESLNQFVDVINDGDVKGKELVLGG
jgi:hypothetical protein